MSLNGFKWSASSLSLLGQCPEAWRRRYLENERFPASPRMVRGRVVHQVAQHAYTQQLREQTLPTAEEAQDLAATNFESAWAEGVLLEPEDKAVGEAAAKGESLDFATDLSGYHVTRVAPGVHPIAVEEAMAATLPESDIIVHGIVDLIAVGEKGDTVRDVKTSERTPNASAADTSIQLTIYSQLIRAELGHFPESVQLDYLCRTPAKRLKSFIPLRSVRDDEDVKVLGARVQAAVSLVEAGVFMPAPIDSYKCSAKFCEFHPTCRFVRRGARPTT